VNPESVRSMLPGSWFRYVDIGSVSEVTGVDLTCLESFRLGDAPSRAQRVIRVGDVLVSTVRPNLRAFALVNERLDGEVASTGFAVLRASEEILPGFVWAVVGARQFVDFLMTRVTGSNYPAVKASDISAYPFRLPPLEEQRRIVDVVGSVDDCVEALDSQIAATRTLRGGGLG